MGDVEEEEGGGREVVVVVVLGAWEDIRDREGGERLQGSESELSIRSRVKKRKMKARKRDSRLLPP